MFVEPGTSPGDPGTSTCSGPAFPDPSGTHAMDFEFNQSHRMLRQRREPDATPTTCSSSTTSTRADPRELFLPAVTNWTGSCVGPTARRAGATAVNLTTRWRPGRSTPRRSLPRTPRSRATAHARTFGEAPIDLDAIFPARQVHRVRRGVPQEQVLGSFTAALKDFIAPVATNLSICGTVHVVKTDDATARLLAGAEFDRSRTTRRSAAHPEPRTPSSDDCTTAAGVCDFVGVHAGRVLGRGDRRTGRSRLANRRQHVTVDG